MGNKYFTNEQVEQLKRNEYVKKVSEKSITYTEEFKERFLLEYNSGKPLSQILIEMGFDPKVLGERRVSNIVQRIKECADDTSLVLSPDGERYFGYLKSYNAYVEVMSYRSLIETAKMRNAIFFKKLGL